MMLAGRRRSGRARSAMAGDAYDPERARRFRDAALPHLDEVYTLARYLLRNAADADDAVQECYLRALRHFDTFRGGGDSALAVRDSAQCLQRGLRAARFADQDIAEDAVPIWSEAPETPEAHVLRHRDEQSIRDMVSALPEPFREAIVLREVHDLSYREIAEIVAAPVGTVMSRLARARSMLRAAWMSAEEKGQ